jgi:ATP-dependent DNA helicase Q4
VAFGLGINKTNVDSVIHFTMPKTLENYIQEVGRSGRDGRIAHCHLFLVKEDYVKHRSFAFSDCPDQSSLWKILEQIFQPSMRKVNFSSLNIAQCEKELDIPESNVMTILSYIESETPGIISVQQG